MMATCFNTGRQYGHNGQTIFAAQQGRVIGFYDETRDVSGYFVTWANDCMTEGVVMQAYDNGTFEPSWRTIDEQYQNAAQWVRDKLAELVEREGS